MRFTRPGISESVIAAHFEYLCSLSGSQRLAYVPVVASGYPSNLPICDHCVNPLFRPNALIIHYTSNNQVVQGGEMILMDAGCEYKSVVPFRPFPCMLRYLQWLRLRHQSDSRFFGCLYLTLTIRSPARTYPASGVFSGPQKDLYTAVLNAQKSLISLCTESAGFSLHQLHQRSCDLLRTELNQIGFDLHPGDLERVLYPHFLSHPIGIGVSFCWARNIQGATGTYDMEPRSA